MEGLMQDLGFAALAVLGIACAFAALRIAYLRGYKDANRWATRVVQMEERHPLVKRDG